MPSLRRTPQREEKADLTPMIDVTFLLLVFFLCTMKFRTFEGRHDAALPKQIGTGLHSADPVEKVDIVAFKLGEDAMRYDVGAQKFRSLQALRGYLESVPLTTPITIDMREGTIHQDFMSILDQCVDRGFDEITIAGTHAQD